jgi:hypothetical protein
MSRQTKLEYYFSPAKTVTKKLSISRISDCSQSRASTKESSKAHSREYDDNFMKSSPKRRRKLSYDCSIMISSGKLPDKKSSPLPPKLTKKITLNQLYLDLGQESFGRQMVCSVCGMLSIHGLQEDVKLHEKVCRYYKHGVPFQSKHARVVTRINEATVVEVSKRCYRDSEDYLSCCLRK